MSLVPLSLSRSVPRWRPTLSEWRDEWAGALADRASSHPGRLFAFLPPRLQKPRRQRCQSVINGTCDVTTLSLCSRGGDVHKSHTRQTQARWAQLDLRVLRELHNSQLIWCVLEWMPFWLLALPCESAIAYWAIFICSLPPRCYFPCVLRERGIKPQPIYRSFPRWSNRMIQKHSHMHRRTHKHYSVHMQPK